MRLCWNDWFNGPLGNIKPEDAKTLHGIGFRVAGINTGDTEASNADIDRAKKIFDDNGIVPGPYGAGRATFHPDPSLRGEFKKQIARALKIGGKLGCTSLRYSVGSMHPDNIWMHHPENHTQKALDMLIEHTKELVTIAEDSGCMLCPETTQWTIVGTIERMKEYVDRLESPYAKIIFDPVNHMKYDRIYDSGTFVKSAIATLGDRIGVLHIKDVMIQDKLLVSHIDEAEMGTGLFDHAALIKASDQLEPWKTFSLEHINQKELVKKAYDHIQSVANSIGHTWTDPKLTRPRWEKMRNERTLAG
jgi:sugar phosphate isomerase/epimerase